jgi:hypothetical protein
VAEPPPSPAVLDAQLNATTSSSDKRLIVLSLHVSGAQRPIHALLDSGATTMKVQYDALTALARSLQLKFERDLGDGGQIGVVVDNERLPSTFARHRSTP